MAAREVPDLPEWVEVGKHVAVQEQGLNATVTLARVLKIHKLQVIVQGPRGGERKFSRLYGLREIGGSSMSRTIQLADANSPQILRALHRQRIEAQRDHFDRWRRDTRGAAPLTLDQVDEGIHIARSLLHLLGRERELLIDEQLPPRP